MTADRESFASLFEQSPARNLGARRLRKGDRLDVKVVAVHRDVVFVDVGGKEEGYIERADWGGGDVGLQDGTVIQAIVAEVRDGRVRLSPVAVRRAEEHGEVVMGDEVFRIPKARSGPILLEGAHIKGTVTGVERYGVFVQIAGTQGRHGRGLVPASETGTPRGADLKKVFPLNAEVEAKILAIGEDGKIRLSISALAVDNERMNFVAFGAADGAAPSAEEPKNAATNTTAKKPPQKPSPRNFGTLADLFQKRK